MVASITACALIAFALAQVTLGSRREAASAEAEVPAE